MNSSWQMACNSVFHDWDRMHIVASPDLDGLLTAAILHERFGARVIAFYTTKDILLLDDASPKDLVKALWVDHDISYPGIRCIGQHLVLHDVNDQLPLRHPVSFNPNHFYNQAYRQSFGGYSGKRRDKYPFATIHFVMNALGRPYPPRGSLGYAMFAHADSAWKNVLLYEYNCTVWADLMFKDDSFIMDLMQSYIHDKATVTAHRKLVDALTGIGVPARDSSEKDSQHKIPVYWHGMSGRQKVNYRRTSNPALFVERLNDFTRLVSSEVGVELPLYKKISATIEGDARQQFPDSIRAGEFDSFMQAEQIFSHAITAQTTLRYTKGIAL